MVLEGKNSWVTVHTWANGICYASSNYLTLSFHKGLCQFCKKVHYQGYLQNWHSYIGFCKIDVAQLNYRVITSFSKKQLNSVVKIK
jgi:hypothetical protein